MLQFIRDRATGWIAWGIVILISIPFALWGISDYLGFGQSATIAEVNGVELGVRDYNNAYQRHRQGLQRLLGTSVDVRDLDDQLIRQQSLDALIQDTLVLQYGEDTKLAISDQQLARAIRVQEPFQLDGQFNEGLYQSWLRNQGYSPDGFEYDLRRSLLLEQVLSGIGGSAIVTATERARMAKLREQTRSFYEVTVAAGQFRNEAIAEADIVAYYEDNKAELNTEENVSLEYVRLSLDSLSAEIETDEEALMAWYEASRLNYTEPEKRQASHILIRLAPDADADEVAVATATINALRVSIEQGETFADVAQEHSQDPGSAPAGGSLGYFERGIMDPAFETAVFAAEQGTLSEPVRSGFGLHLIEVTDIVEGRTKTFEEAREEILGEYRQRQAEELYFEQIETLTDLAFDASDTLSVAAEALGLEVVRVDGVGRAGSFSDLVASDPKVVEAAFSYEVLEEGHNSAVIELPQNEVAVIRVVEHEPARPQTLDEARARISSLLAEQQARRLAESTGQQIVDKLRAGEQRNEVLGELELEWEYQEALSRQDPLSSTEMRDLVFSMPRPGATPVVDGVTTAAGDFAIVVLTDVNDGDPTALQLDDLNVLESELLADYGRTAYDAFVGTLRADADVVVNEDSITGNDYGY